MKKKKKLKKIKIDMSLEQYDKIISFVKKHRKKRKDYALLAQPNLLKMQFDIVYLNVKQYDKLCKVFDEMGLTKK